MKPSLRRAVGVVRVSRVGDRDGERFVSPSEQRERIDAACQRNGLQVLEVVEEPDLSCGATLECRQGALSTDGNAQAQQTQHEGNGNGHCDRSYIAALFAAERHLAEYQAQEALKVERRREKRKAAERGDP